MKHSKPTHPASFPFFFLPALLLIAAMVAAPQFQAASEETNTSATYSRGLLDLTIPYHTAHPGAGQLTVEVLDPEDQVLASAEQRVDVAEGGEYWREGIKLPKPLAVEDLVWHRVRYRFEYSDGTTAPIGNTESISQILRTPVVHILGQQSYLTGGPAAVRVIVSDSKNQVISGRGSVRIELLIADRKSQLLFTGRLNRRGTTEAQFRFPAGLVGSYQLRYVVDTSIGATELTQPVRLEDKVSILLTTEKPIYQPGQTIHVRALALDRSDHHAAADRKLTFEVEDSRGNKVFKKATQTDKFGIASAEFALADEVNLGAYHSRALMRSSAAIAKRPPTPRRSLSTSSAMCCRNSRSRLISPGRTTRRKRGYRPGDHVTGTVHANYFFGKPVDDAEITVKASSMDVSVFEAASVERQDRSATARITSTSSCPPTSPDARSARAQPAC